MNHALIKKTILLISVFFPLLIPMNLSAGVEDIFFVNAGKMYIGDKQKVALYIQSAVRMTGSEVNITLEGKAVITGNFFQDSEGNVFDPDSDGTFVFSNEEDQTITSSVILPDNFDRGKNYVAFPMIEMDKNSKLIVVPKMGIDAVNIVRTTGKTGVLYLQSAPADNTGNAGIYDASLRITGNQQPVAGSVIVERYVEGYRGATFPECALFPFATPFKNTQRAGYFAGNWLRTTLPDDNKHVAYPLANTPAPDGKIQSSHYIQPVETILEPGTAYYSRLRPSGGYDDLEFVVTGDDGNHEKPTFIFDGNVYSLPFVNEVLFNDDMLFHGSLNNFQPQQTINWVIGNSYTSPLSIEKITVKMGESALEFVPYIYVFYGGQTGFLPIKVYEDGTPAVIETDEIPSMAVFMIRVSKNYIQNGELIIGRTERIHGEIPHNLKSETGLLPDVLFRLSLASNPLINDLSVIGIREEGTLHFGDLDMEKSYNSSREIFQLYTESNDGVKLSSNAIPSGKVSVPLFVDVKEGLVNLVLEASRLERMTGYNVFLEDLITKQHINLKERNLYEFETGENSDALRFMVHFETKGTGLEENTTDDELKLYCAQGQLILNGLTEEHRGKTINILDTRGIIIKSLEIDSYPVWSCPVNFQSGIYIAHIKSKKPFVAKFHITTK